MVYFTPSQKSVRGNDENEKDRRRGNRGRTDRLKAYGNNKSLDFNGNAEESFNFYKSVFGGDFSALIRFKDGASPGMHVSENEAEKIMRIALPIGKNVLMANDVPEILGRVSEEENRSKISVGAESKEEADRIFNGLSAGGAVEMHMAESAWGTYFGMFRDKYGIEWTVEFDPKVAGRVEMRPISD